LMSVRPLCVLAAMPVDVSNSSVSAFKCALLLRLGTWQCWGNSSADPEILLGGPQEKMSFFEISSGPILSIPIYLKTCLYGPCKFPLKKNDQNLPAGHVKVLIFCRSSLEGVRW
jgi:hypothetical protein